MNGRALQWKLGGDEAEACMLAIHLGAGVVPLRSVGVTVRVDGPTLTISGPAEYVEAVEQSIDERLRQMGRNTVATTWEA